MQARETPRAWGTCQAEGCARATDSFRLFCARCWAKVPYPLRLEIARHFRAARASSGPRRYRHRRAARRAAREAAVQMTLAQKQARRRREKAKGVQTPRRRPPAQALTG